MTAIAAIYVLAPAAVFSAFSPSLLAGLFPLIVSRRKVIHRILLALLTFAVTFLALVSMLIVVYYALGLFDPPASLDEKAAMSILVIDYAIHSLAFLAVAAWIIRTAKKELSSRAAIAFAIMVIACECAYLIDVLSLSLRLHAPPWGFLRVAFYVVLLILLENARRLATRNRLIA